MTLISDIMKAVSGLGGYSYHVMPSGQVVFSGNMRGHKLTALCTVADPQLSLDSIPDRFQQAATYYIMHRYFSGRDNVQSEHYRTLYAVEWAKVRHNRLRPLESYLGDDL